MEGRPIDWSLALFKISDSEIIGVDLPFFSFFKGVIKDIYLFVYFLEDVEHQVDGVIGINCVEVAI